ncbi:MAG: chromosomal replication initiator protein DnaA [Spirochaetaceae bacterium]|nr:chromosomal replication initiator protein DnaA [Spirochaetaceae bacterium]
MVSVDYKPFWEEALKQIEHEFISNKKESEFRLWFNITYVKSQGNKIVASVPSSYIKDQMQTRNYNLIIQDKIQEISGQDLELEITIVPKKRTESIKNDSFENNESNIYPTVSTKKNITNTREKKQNPDLNPVYTFENFVSGDENQYVYNAALAASKNPGKSYNPLLIYGGVGLGKTHLMQAIGNKIYTDFGMNIIYISAENFTNEFVLSIQNKTQNQFKAKYRKADVLLIDDIHFFQDKEGTQEELFHTFNALYENDKQLVFTCDRPVSELKNMTERLKSRFQRGINADIHMPKYEIRHAIINHKLNLMGKSLSSDIIDLIAQNIQTNVRDLEACLKTIVSYEELTSKPMTIDVAKTMLLNTFSQNTSLVSIETIQKVVADYFGVSASEIKGKKRSKNIALPRHISFYLSREMTEYSTTEIGNEFGGKDHTTVMHACQKIEDLLNTDSSMVETIRILKKKIKECKK